MYATPKAERARDWTRWRMARPIKLKCENWGFVWSFRIRTKLEYSRFKWYFQLTHFILQRIFYSEDVKIEEFQIETKKMNSNLSYIIHPSNGKHNSIPWWVDHKRKIPLNLFIVLIESTPKSKSRKCSSTECWTYVCIIFMKKKSEINKQQHKV